MARRKSYLPSYLFLGLTGLCLVCDHMEKVRELKEVRV